MWSLVVLLLGTVLSVHGEWLKDAQGEIPLLIKELNALDSELNDAQPRPCSDHEVPDPDAPSGCSSLEEMESCDRHWHKIGCYSKMVSEMLLDDGVDESEYLTDINKFEGSTHSLACRCAKTAKMKGFRYFSLRFWGMCHAISTATMLKSLDNPGSSVSHNCASSKQWTTGPTPTTQQWNSTLAPCDATVEDECLGFEADYVYGLYDGDKEDPNKDGGLSPWSTWSQCNVPCGPGTQTRTRTCTNPAPKGNGRECVGVTKEVQECSQCDCKVDGGWSDWGLYTSCSKSCGGGVKYRLRTCTNPSPDKGGAYCVGDATEMAHCETDPCPIDGCYSEWMEWGSCSAQCGEGVKKRYRRCNSPAPDFGGRSCDHLGEAMETMACVDKPCPVHGKYSRWSDFSRCTAKCGGGKQSRIRVCSNPFPQHGGRDCVGESVETIDCGTHPCPIDGAWSGWTEWSTCSVSCGGGITSRSRKCDSPAAQYEGKECEGDGAEQKECNAVCCPEAGEWAAWSSFGECSEPCREVGKPPGTMVRDRRCSNPPPRCGGASCPGPETDVAPCNENFFCPINGGYAAWTEWSPCTEPCKAWNRPNGWQSRSRSCTNPAPQFGGWPCFLWGEPSEVRQCNSQPCSKYTNWGEWSVCTKTCGGGTRTRSRTCTGGSDCDGPSEETGPCEEQCCPNDPMANWGQWSAFSACSKPCGTGHHNRTRKCDSPPPTCGGDPCPGSATETHACKIKECPIDGGLTPWTLFGVCSQSCNGGVKRRTRECTNPAPEHGGAQCGGDLVNEAPCNQHVCPFNCEWRAWGDWAPCTATCGGGRRWRTRMKNPERDGGLPCFGSTFELDFLCNADHCPINGQWGGWDAWGACSKSCGGGVQHSERRCDSPVPQYKGCKGCSGGDEASRKTRPCNTEVHCPIDGYYSQWSDFSECSHKCGGGQKTRTRVCTHPKYNGAPCSDIGAAEDTVSCNNHLCEAKGMSCGCQGESATLSCKEGGGLIHISQQHDVYYGREEVAVCGQAVVEGWDYNCRASDGKAKVSAQCEGKQECTIPVNNDYFGNPCKGTFKYLRVHYECTGGQYETLRHFCTQCLHAKDGPVKVIDIAPSLP